MMASVDAPKKVTHLGRTTFATQNLALPMKISTTAWIGIGGVVLAIAAALAYSAWRRPHLAHFDMVAALAAFVANEGPWDNEWDKPQEKIQGVLTLIRSEHDPQKRFELRRELAQRYVYAGTIEAAISTLEELQKEVGKSVPAAYGELLKADMAFAYFRMGETQNCTWNHNSDSCLFPIQGEGIHKQQLGATEAAKIYAELLSDPSTNPQNALAYRWLLNISYMTLGQYPDQVPKRWLIPPDTFKSSYDIGAFRDVAVTRGVADFGAAGGVILEDFDNDGHLDLMISHMGIGDQLEYFHNNGNGTFTRMTEKAGLKGIVGGLNIVQADYNNDGCIDVLVLRGAWLHDKGKWPPSLLRNNCDGTFTDVTAEAGLLYYYPTHTAAWADVNNDGLLDLFVGHEIDRTHVDWPAGTKNFELYLNNGDGTFREVGAQTGIRLDGFIKGSVWGDYDNDGWQDLYVTTWGGGNHLFHNLGADANGIPKFDDVTAKAGVGEPQKSFTTWFFDYNNDGWPDIFVSGYSAPLPEIVREYLGQPGEGKGERARLYRNNKDGTFTDVSHEVGLDKLLLTMGANFGDLDNDGWLDLYLGTGDPRLTSLVPNRMFRNAEGKYFQDVSTSGGFGHLQKGHGVAFGDIDNDGNQDIFEVMGGVYPTDKFWSVLYKNPGHGNHWLKLRLTGVKANRFAVGARLRVEITEEGQRRQVFRDVNSGGSFGASSFRPHIGVGKATTIDLLEIRWPGSGLVQQFKGPIAADRTYEITEGKPELKPIEIGKVGPQPAK
jgi:ASPIC and UnbV/FG-GAP-like repeat